MGVGIDVVLVVFDNAADCIELVTLIDLDEEEMVELDTLVDLKVELVTLIDLDEPDGRSRGSGVFPFQILHTEGACKQVFIDAGVVDADVFCCN